jgi:HipA-like protein
MQVDRPGFVPAMAPYFNPESTRHSVWPLQSLADGDDYVRMKRLLGRAVDAIWDQFESWLLRVPRATYELGPCVYVTGPGKGIEPTLIGTLSQQDGQFVFRYDPAFAASPDARPIPGFPVLDDEYWSRVLWPFFVVRIPPADRSDVRDALARRGLRPRQTLEVLGTLANRFIANTYRFDLSRCTVRPRVEIMEC